MQKPHTNDTKYLEAMFDEIIGLRATIREAKDRMRYYFGNIGGGFDDPQLQNVYDVLCREDDRKKAENGN